MTAVLLAGLVTGAAAGPGSAAELDGRLSARPERVVVGTARQSSVTLTNSTPLRLPVEAAVLGRDGRPAEGATVRGPAEIAPFGRADVEVTVPAVPVAGLELVVVSGEGDGREALRVPIGVAPAARSWTLRRVQPYGHVDGEDLPLTGPCAYLGVAPGARIGFVAADGNVLSISGRCPDPDAPSLRLAASDRPWAGRAYTGRIVLGQSGESVDVRVVTSSAWWLVASLVGVGIAAALAVNRWLNGGRAVAELRWRLLGIEALVERRNPRSADALFGEAARRIGLPSAVRSWTLRPAVTARVRELRTQLRPEFGKPRVDVAVVAAAVDELDDTVRGWPETANLVGLLCGRLGSIGVLEVYLDGARARTVDRRGGAEISLDEARQIKTSAREAATLAGDWPGDKIFATAELARNLDESAPAWQRWQALRNRFAGVRTVAAAEQAREEYEHVDAEVRAAVATVLRTGRPDPPTGLDRPDVPVGAVVSDGEVVGLVAREPVIPTLFVRADVATPSAEATGLARRILVFDQAIMVALLVAVLLAGMKAFYVDRTFGGAWDAALAVSWGLAGGIVAGPLSTALGRAAESVRSLLG